MGKQKRYMALDFGAASGVAMCGAFDGAKLSTEVLHRFPVNATAMLNVRYWDFPAMLINAKKGLSLYTAKHGPEVAGVAVDSWGCDFGLLDKTGHLLSNPVSHLDPRTRDMMDRLHGTVPERSLYQRTGIKSRREVTLFQLYSMAMANSPLLDKAVTMLMIADLVSYCLSGTPVQEYTLATTTGMYDAENMDWSRDIILSAKIPPVMMPEIVAPGTMIGPMLDSVAAECGMGQVPIIAPGAHSFAGAVAATPAKGEDWITIASGDWNQVTVEVSAPIINDAAFAAGFTNEGGVDGSIRFLKGIMGFIPLEECVKVWSREDGRELDVGAILELADAAHPLERVIDPDHPKIYELRPMPDLINELLAESGQPVCETRSDMVRLCLDSMILTHRHAIEQLVELTDRKYSVIHVVGWGSHVRFLTQSLADATGYPVMAGPVEAKAVGNILLQAIALGDIGSLAQARDVVRDSFTIERFEPSDDTGKWDEAYERFLRFL